MATYEEMAIMVNNVYDNSGEMASRFLKRVSRKYSILVIEMFYQILRDAEDNGRYYNGMFGADNEACTYWVVGDYIVTYLTDDEDFDASMLTEDMMYDLIIEVR